MRQRGNVQLIKGSVVIKTVVQWEAYLCGRMEGTVE